MNTLVAFYHLLGLTFTEEKHGNGPSHFSTHIHAALFEIYPLPASASVVDTSTRLGFKIDNLETTIQLLKEQGSAIITEPKQSQWGYFAVVKDPDGRTVELYQK